MRVPTEMELRVAEAFKDALGEAFNAVPLENIPGSWTAITEDSIIDCVDLAKATIRAMREASPDMLAPIACLIAPDDLPEDMSIVEHPRRLDRCAESVAAAWGADIDAASPPDV